MTRRVHLIRHAHAEDRASWSQPDAARPLSKRGRRQAMQLGELAVAADSPVYSSPAVRCVGTVVPLASTLGTEVTVDERLAEGADPGTVVEWIASDNDAEIVICSHGDLLPEVLRLLAMRGMTLDGPNACKKASIWACTFDGDQPLHASYRPPPKV